MPKLRLVVAVMVLAVACGIAESTPPTIETEPTQSLLDEAASCCSFPVEDVDRIELYREVFHHSSNLWALQQLVEEVRADRVVDQVEFEDMCFKGPQWKVQLEAAVNYLVKYRGQEPDYYERSSEHQYLVEATQTLHPVITALEQDCGGFAY